LPRFADATGNSRIDSHRMGRDVAIGKAPHQAEIDALQRMFVAEDSRTKCPRFWRGKLVSVLCALNVAFIIGVAVYLIGVYGWRFVQWLDVVRP